MRVPVCVPGLMLNLTSPSTVLTRMSPPKAACAKDIDVVVYKSIPLRSNSLLGITLISTSKSPLGPPFVPGSPSPVFLILCISSIPAGISIMIFFLVDL